VFGVTERGANVPATCTRSRARGNDRCGAGHLLSMAAENEHVDVDRDYFESLYRRHYAAIMRFAARRTDEQSARDVTAETFLTAWRRLDAVPRDNELAWLYTTVRNVLRDELRGQTRRSRLDARLQSQPLRSDRDVADGVVDTLHAQRLFDALPPKDREALQLVEWEQLDIGTAAQVVGCSAATVRVRLHRARRRLAALGERAERAPDEHERPIPSLRADKAST
jgi:RNA polymerase sigma factor (sigma-70 family)